LIALACTPGCYVERASAPEPGRVLDPCAERLHDLSGRLLLYRFAQGRLPPSLAGLPPDGAGAAAFSCPLSGKPYLYRLDGPAAPGRAGRHVAYDATPCHDGGRWGVAIADGGGGQVTARVVWVAEESFQTALGALTPVKGKGR
jgi:hypothetical protein